MKNFREFKYAFTLAEVLITLGIIGIVASITIPILMNNVQDQQWKTAYKKAYSDLSQVMLSAKNNYDFVEMDGGNTTFVKNNFDALYSYFKATKYCNNSTTEGCWVDTCSTLSDCSPATGAGYAETSSWGFIDSSGRFWSHYRATGQTYLRIVVDTNGAKPPNSYGRDKWYFRIWGTTGQNLGTPNNIEISPDITSSGVAGCKLGNCYYTSYLMN